MPFPFGTPEALKRKDGPQLITIERFKELCTLDLEMGIGDFQTDIQQDVTNPIMAQRLVKGDYPEAYVQSLRDLRRRLIELEYVCTDLAMAEFLATRFIDKSAYTDKTTYPGGSPIADYLEMIEKESTGLEGKQ